MTSDAIVSLVLRKLGEEARFLSRVPDDMLWIQRELTTLQSSLKDADDAKHKKSARARNWVQQVREVACDAEDIIDNFIGEAARREAFRRGVLRRPFDRFASYPRELITDHTVGVQIQKIKLRISDLSRNKQAFDINAFTNEQGGGQQASCGQALDDYRRDVALWDKPAIVGMREDMMILKERLSDGDPKLRVISIVGMGGSGKTTLAKQVHRDVENHFDCHAFIYLSQKYKPREILTSLIKSVMRLAREEIEKLNDEELKKKLQCHLSGKRYLVVIDDVWSRDAWDQLKCILPDSSNQSRVMLTTRNRDIAAHADRSSPPLEIRLLKEDEAWELFMRKTFSGENAPIVCPEELERTGRDILRKCHGLPLAIVILGGLLSRREAILSAWSLVLDDVTRRLAQSPDSERLMEILALSYYDLHSDWKPCFLYFGLFPGNEEISSKRLIRMWVAEGFFQQKQENNRGISEVQAEECLRELIARSMIQVATKRTNGSVRTCRIHDLLRDLSIHEAEENNFFAIHAASNTNNGSSSVRRLALYCHTEVNEAINCPTLNLRSMLCFSDCEINFSKLFKKDNKVLRVLETGGKEMRSKSKIPENIGDFVNLRYLSLRGHAIKSLPSSIRKLSKLLTLELTFKGTLPKEICDLYQLRHLYAYDYVIGGKPLLRHLRHLQTLCLYAGSWIKDCLGELTNLRKLGIHGDLRAHHTALPISIGKLYSLRSLKLECGNSIPQNMSFNLHQHIYKIFLEGRIEDLPELPQTLTKLTLSKSELKEDAIDTLGRLPKLKTLRLLAGSYCSESMICSSERFCRLEFLKLDCSNLKELIGNDDSMPSLNRVELLNEDNLRILFEKVRDLLRKKASGA